MTTYYTDIDYTYLWEDPPVYEIVKRIGIECEGAGITPHTDTRVSDAGVPPQRCPPPHKFSPLRVAFRRHFRTLIGQGTSGGGRSIVSNSAPAAIMNKLLISSFLCEQIVNFLIEQIAQNKR